MDAIGPLTFNAARFFIGAITLLPMALFFELKPKKNKIIFNKKTTSFLIFIGICLFLGSVLQQYSLLYTDVANSAFFTTTYVIFVPLLSVFLFSRAIHWSIWPAIVFCFLGSYLLSQFSNAIVRSGDMLVLLGALFWALHIIFISKLILNFSYPFLIASIQALIVGLLSIILALIFEDISFSGILMEFREILFAGVLSSGFAFLLQIYGQRFLHPAPVAIIFSLEGVFAAFAAWLILAQVLTQERIVGCGLILLGVLLSQLLPIIFPGRK